jgi:hypothetical protein
MPQARRQPRESAAAVAKERATFKSLVAKNPNYFGNLEKSKFKPVKKIVTDTFFEQATCVGFNPQTNFLEATIAVKRPTGYAGDLCHAGSTEYVRFYLDYGNGWEDQGLTGVQVHDIPNSRDCEGRPDKPLTYVASLRIDPRRDCCTEPVLPRIRAILSWQWMPPANQPNWKPVWGNVLECAIQIAPHPWNIFCLLEEIGDLLGTKLKVPPLFEEVQFVPIPLPDPPPFELEQLAELYGGGGQAKAARASAKTAVEPHRFGVAALHPLLAQGGFDASLLEATTSSFEAIGLSLEQAIAALEKTNADVGYEEIECLGLDETLPERLVASFRIKRPTGYSGDLCQAGSQEYIAFWADWEDTCEWTYLGTVQVNVHDIAQIPAGGLCYSAILPVDLTHHRRSCKEPKIARVRAVLSWAVPPSTTDPDKLEYWGNRLDAHVLISPGDEIPPGGVEAKIRNLGGIAIEDIDTGGNGMTLGFPHDVRFAHFPGSPADGSGLQRECPFGGRIEIEGNFFPGYWYRVKVRKSSDPPTSFTVLGDSFLLERAWVPGYDTQISVGGFFAYANPLNYFTRILAEWNTGDDGPWEVQLDVATAPNEPSIILSSPWYTVLIDNTGPVGPPAVTPSMDIHIAAGGDCKDFDQGITINGTFVANVDHFGSWSLSTEPNTVTTPSNPPQPSPFLAGTTPTAGHGWTLNTTSPVKMKPCGYVVRLDVSDRTIVNSWPGSHNSGHIEVGFCLRAKPN